MVGRVSGGKLVWREGKWGESWLEVWRVSGGGRVGREG